MNPQSFLEKLIEELDKAKTSIVLILLTISIIQMAYASFLGGNEARGIYGRVLTLFVIAALIFALPSIVTFLSSMFNIK